MALEILVLAAGRASACARSLPKVLHPLAGRPLLAHVLATARALSPRKVDRGARPRRAKRCAQAFAGEQVEWVLQAEQLGTGARGACRRCRSVGADADVLILYGDVPLDARRDAQAPAGRGAATGSRC